MRLMSNEAEVCALCQELVRCPSLSGDEAGVADIVEREMLMLGYDAVQRDALGSVIGVVKGALPGRTVLFDAHMDVVPATTPSAWRFPPFSGERAEGRIWGRGATDVKGSLAAALVAVGTLRRERLAGTLILAATVGEEMFEGLALERVLRERPADRVVICEPTDLRLGLGHKGRCALVLEAEGVAAHSSRPEEGVNAVYRIIEAIERIRALPPRRDELLGPGVTELVEIVSSPFPGTSMVPDRCAARFDRRLVRGETPASVLQEMEGAIAGLEGVTLRYHRPEMRCYTGMAFTPEDFHPAWALSSEGDMVRAAQRALASVGQAGAFCYAPFCSNGSASAGALGIPTLIYGAGHIGDAHRVDEPITVEALAGAYRGYRALAMTLTAP